MNGATICSGIGAPECALPELDWIWSSEIEKFPSLVLKRRHPESVNLGDFTAPDFLERATAIGKPDVLVAGTPCQAFSIAGNRESLSDDRGQLTLKFIEIVHAIRPVYTLWENVPGIFSADDNPFGCFLGGLVGAGAIIDPPNGKWTDAGVVSGPIGTAAWRVTDAQYFGLAQRRKRVFVVFCFGKRADPAEILFEWENVRRDSPPRREAGQDSAGTLSARTSGGGGFGTDFELQGGVIPILEAGARTGSSTDDVRAGMGVGIVGEPMFTLQAGKQHGVFASTGDISHCLNAGGMGRIDYETETLIAHTLKGEGFDASEDGTGRGVPLVAVPFDTTQITSRANRSNPQPGDPCHPLVAEGHPPASAFRASGQEGFEPAEICPPLTASDGGGAGVPTALAFNLRGREDGAQLELSDVASIRAASGGSSRSYVATDAVRRLMPIECERLQGFPDRYTCVQGRKRRKAKRHDPRVDEFLVDPADGPRYKALGNSMAVPNIRFIGLRIIRSPKQYA